MTMQIRRNPIAGTNIVCFSAWEPSRLIGDHSTLTSDGTGKWVGRVGSNRNLPAEIEALRGGSDERIAAVRGWYNEQYERAYTAIVAEYPEAVAGQRDSGEIVIRV